MLKLLLTITCRNVSTFRDLTQLFAAESIGCFCLLWESTSGITYALLPFSVFANLNCSLSTTLRMLTTGLRSRSRKESEVFGWSRRFLGGVGVGFLTTLGIGVAFFCPTPDVQLDQFLHHTPKLGIPVEIEISCSATRFPLILTDKFHSLYAKESE